MIWYRTPPVTFTALVLSNNPSIFSCAIISVTCYSLFCHFPGCFQQFIHLRYFCKVAHHLAEKLGKILFIILGESLHINEADGIYLSKKFCVKTLILIYKVLVRF